MFLGKIKNSDDRDCVIYMEFKGFECDHYFAGLRTSGACFSGRLNEIKDNIDNFESILTKEELLRLFELDKMLDDLGYGIEKGSEKYNKGIEILNEYENTIGKKLASEENEKLFKKIIEEEKEIMKEEWNLTDKDIEDIFENYYLEYRDRGIINYVYDDVYDLGEEMIDSYYNLDDNIKRYIDYEKFGNDLLLDDYYVELDDGRVVSLNY